MTFTRYLFASDLHASDIAFRKFVTAALQYRVDVAITSELTGKFIVPAVKYNDGTVQFMFRDEVVNARSEAERKVEEAKTANIGSYVYYCTKEEYDELKNKPSAVDDLFKKLTIERLRSWLNLANEKLRGKVKTVMMMPCNDDQYFVDDVLAESDWVINPEGKVLSLGRNEFFATGYCNMTPWKCPRDVGEEELESRLDSMCSQVKDWKNAVVHTHCPPYDTKIDNAPMLDENFKVVYKGGAPVMQPVGSTSVRKMVEKCQPLLGLHGHIHEGKGIDHIGKTTVINSGSEYHKGLLSGVLINLEDARMKGYMFIIS
jgi:Icc-related predicted phosphoesterase